MMSGGKKAIICLMFFILIIFLGFICGCNGEESISSNAATGIKTLSAGEEWILAETTHLSKLVVNEGASVKAVEEHTATLTVDGVEMPMKPGVYEGDVVLTVAEEIVITASVFGDVSTYRMRAAIDIEDGAYRPEKSVAASVTGGSVGDTAATGVRINSIGENFNGIIVQGDTNYTIESPDINFNGYGGNDFAGYGAAIMIDGNADVTVNNASIKTKGSIRSGAVVRGNSTLRVNDSDIEVENGALPEGYVFHWENPDGVTLMMVPWMLGLTGNCRATNIVESGTAFYNNTHIKAQGWGALSTDGVKDVTLNAKDCHIETIDSGYGSYADGSTNNFSSCTFDVRDYALIITGGSGTFTDSCTINSGRFGVMSHGSGDITIDKGTVFNTEKAVFQLKSAMPSIVVDNAVLSSKSGIILQAMVNDDPNNAGSGAAGAPPPTAGNASGDIPGGPGGGNAEARAVFRNTTLAGDIVTSMTSVSDVVVSFENTLITGAITTAVAEHAVGPNGEKLVMQDATDLYYLIGDVKETYCATDDEFGIKVSLDGNSTWIVRETSYLTELSLSEGAAVKAPEGHALALFVDGSERPIKPGGYKGRIVLELDAI